LEQVFERFMALTGLDEEQAEPWRWICADAYSEYKSRAREGAQRCGGRLSAVAAALANYKYAALCGRDEAESFKAGDVSVNMQGSRVEYARELWQQAERAAADLLEDGQFFFKRV